MQGESLLSSWQPEPKVARGWVGGETDQEMEGGTLSLIPCGSVFLLQLIYSPEEGLLASAIFYSRLTRQRGPQAGKESKRTVNMFY